MSDTHTIDELCKLEKISRAHLYELWRQGRGPRFYRLGNRRRITEQARQDWHHQLEAEGLFSDLEIGGAE